MGSVTLLLGIHNHQPVGNFESVFEEAYQKAYLPWAKALLNHPEIRWNLHNTGILWDFLETHHPEYFDMVRVMLSRGQLEILTGGYYEPILAVLPDADKQGQIRKLTDYVKKHFGVVPEGLWCAERVWEPHLPKALEAARVRYTVLDDFLFHSSGLSDKDLRGYYRVEEAESKVDVFPITGVLRFLIPFQPIENSINYLRSLSEQEGPALAVMADDGEKFGHWPETYKSVYEDGWLENFFKALDENKSWLKTDLFSNVRKSQPPEGRIYLPAASYFEMSEWSLPTESRITFKALKDAHKSSEGEPVLNGFFTGGTWRNFLSKYPESNSMYKKMLRVSKKVHAAKNNSKALDRLWAGQCNCSYWHGTFGGLYFPILRQAIYRNLIAAEIELDQMKKSARERIEISDFDGDGSDEVLYESPRQNVYVAPAAGGSVFEWDFKSAGINVLNVLTRRQEPYHASLESGDGLAFDWYRRTGGIDHFFHPETTMEAFSALKYGEHGDFVTGAYGHATNKKSHMILTRKGSVLCGAGKIPVEIRKIIKPQSPGKSGTGLEIEYNIMNLSNRDAELWFGSEWNLAFAVLDPKTDRPFNEVLAWERSDPHLRWKFSAGFDQKTSGWVMPLETVSNSIEGIEKTFQGLVFLPFWKMKLKAGEQFRANFAFALTAMDGLK